MARDTEMEHWLLQVFKEVLLGNRQCGPVLVSLKKFLQGSPDGQILYLHQEKVQEMQLTKTQKYMEISRFYKWLHHRSYTKNYI